MFFTCLLKKLTCYNLADDVLLKTQSGRFEERFNWGETLKIENFHEFFRTNVCGATTVDSSERAFIYKGCQGRADVFSQKPLRCALMHMKFCSSDIQVIAYKL